MLKKNAENGAVKMKLWHHGTIRTMDGTLADAVLVDGGTIAAVGSRDELLRRAGADCEQVDLGGAALLPGFVDGHSHFVQFANSLQFASLSSCASFADIQETLRRHKRENGLSDSDWLIGFGYDHTMLREGRHPDRHILDAVSEGNPVLISHASGHMGCVNTAGLRAAGITAQTPDPAGGRIGREEAGQPSGYLEELAFTGLASAAPRPSPEQMLRLLRRAQELYFSYGITTAQEGLMKAAEFDLLRAAEAFLKLDVVGYADIRDNAALVEEHPDLFSYHGHFRLGGYKLFLDGSPQGRTAWVSAPYEKAEGQDASYCGYPIYDDAQVRAFVEKAEREGRQLLTHCNGDAAIDQLLGAFAAPTKNRDVVIHAQLMRKDQLPRVKALGLMPSYFVAHTWFWGDVHLKNFGPARAGVISPLASTAALGIPFTLHQDTPVLPPDMLQTVWCAVRRVTKDGVPLSSSEAVSPETALEAVTRGGAYQYFEENAKGTLSPGKRADFVILERDPAAVEVDEIPRIRVLATVKDGETVYRRDADSQ